MLFKVINSSGEYAFLMESNSIQYQIERNCDLIQVGNGNGDGDGNDNGKFYLILVYAHCALHNVTQNIIHQRVTHFIDPIHSGWKAS